MNLKSMKKSIKKHENALSYYLDTPYGSLVATLMILHPELVKSNKDFIDSFKGKDFPFIEDPLFLKKTINTYFGADNIYDDYAVGEPICMVKTDWNVLFVPYVVDDENNIFPITVRKDGSRPLSLDKGIISVIDWSEVDD